MGRVRLRALTAAIGTLGIAVSAAACGERSADLHLASTTSTYDSGLLDDLVPAFEAAHPEYSVKAIVVGSGEALELGRRKDVDVLLTHAPAAEIAFVADGFGLARLPFMYNDFVILGPDDDPAGLRAASGAADGLRRIAAAEVGFLSRGDDSGTHKRERVLWSLAGIEPAGDWYMEAGEGMAASLLVAAFASSASAQVAKTWPATQNRSGCAYRQLTSVQSSKIFSTRFHWSSSARRTIWTG